MPGATSGDVDTPLGRARPGSPPCAGSSLIVDTEGSLSLSRVSGLRVDLWEHEAYARKLMATPDHERGTLLAHARRLVLFDWGRFLGGMHLGEWVEPYRRAHDELRMGAVLRAAAPMHWRRLTMA